MGSGTTCGGRGLAAEAEGHARCARVVVRIAAWVWLVVAYGCDDGGRVLVPEIEQQDGGAQRGQARAQSTAAAAPAAPRDGTTPASSTSAPTVTAPSDAARSPVAANDEGDGGVDEVASAGIGTQQPPAEPSPAPAWRMYGFDARNTQVNPHEKTLGVDNVADLQARWQWHMPDGATSTPVVVDGTAFFGGWDGKVYAVDAASGELRWERRVTQGQANSTPLVTAERVYVTAGAALLSLSRADGEILYEVLLDTHPAAMIWSSPKMVDDMLVVGVASFENGITVEPTFVGKVVALEAADGSEIWRVLTTGEQGFGPCYGGPGAAVWSSAAFDEELGLAYVGTGQGYLAPASTCSDAILAIDYRRDQQGDRVRWFAQYNSGDIFGLINWFTGPDADVGAGPNLFEVDGRRLVGAGDKGGTYRAFDRETGELVWRTELTMGPFVAFGGVTSTAAVEDDTIYVVSNNIVTARFIVEAIHDPQDRSRLYALNTADGEIRWSVELPAPLAGSLAVANGVLYHPVVNRQFFARDARNGEVLWSTELPNDPGAGPSVVDGRLYVSAGMALTVVVPTALGGFVTCFSLEDAALARWEAAPDALETLDEDACHERMQAQPQPVSAACEACLCSCDPTAAGHCGACMTLAACTEDYCRWAAPGDEMKSCLERSCDAKLLPSFVFERALALAPCTIRCADACASAPAKP